MLDVYSFQVTLQEYDIRAWEEGSVNKHSYECEDLSSYVQNTSKARHSGKFL